MFHMMKNPNRVIGEIELLSTHFGNVHFDPADPSTVTVESFDLPSGFCRRYAELLIDLGPLYPDLPPQDFYLSQGLRKKGSKLTHYFEDGPYSKRYCECGYAWYSLHIKKWRPDPCSMIRGDNLLTAVQALYEALSTD
ncbi:hypothetical protein ACFL5Z_12900 [Planctomycetota bacterium]